VAHEDKKFFEGPAWDAATNSLYFTVFEGKVTEIRRLDAQGRVTTWMRGGVWVVAPSGKLLGLIPIKEFASNVGFGGADGKTLFVTCEGKVYALAMNVRGA